MPLYLEAAKFLFKEEHRNAREKLSEIVNYVKEKPNSLRTLSWDFDDIKKAEVYKSFQPAGEARQLFDRMVNYLKRNVDVRLQFEAGNFLEVAASLTEAQPPLSN